MKRPWQKHLPAHKTTPSEFAFAAAIDVFVLCGLGVLLWLCLGFASGAKGAELVPGSVLVSRNKAEAENTSPGHMNHLAIAVNATEVVESQAGVGVQKISLADYLKRSYEQPLVLLPRDRGIGERAATKAASFVGTKFAKASSIFRRQSERRGMNCVGLVKASYFDAHRKVRTIKIPDDIWKLKEVFEPARRLERSVTNALSGAGGDRYGWFIHKRGQEGGILREMLSRCPSYGLAQIRSMDRVTQCHEATHFVNHELSQPFQQSYGAFYVGDCRYVVLRAPNVTVGQVARYVPQEQRTPRYTLYLTGDRVARNCLTLLDEWTCYANDAQCTKELGLQTDGGLKYANEFSGFVDTTVETIRQYDTAYDLEPLTQFVAWQKARVAELSK